LYEALGGRDGALRLSAAFYTRVKRDPVLRPLFPGKSIRCAVNAFAAFLAQFLGGPPEDAQERWFLSLRESHLRFRIGPLEQQAWMNNMAAALEDVPLDEAVRVAFRDFFVESSGYIVNTGGAAGHPAVPLCPDLARRWDEQRALDELVAAIRHGDADRALRLAPGRDRAVLAHVLGLMMQSRHPALLEYVERAILADPALAHVYSRYGRTLLHDAAAYGNLRIVELLLTLGADPNAQLAGRHPPLYHVANEFHFPGGGDIVRALVRAGAQVDARSDSKQCTALHMAARRGNTEIAQALIECGADLHARDRSGDTPLERARN